MRLLALTAASDRAETALLMGLKDRGVAVEVMADLAPAYSRLLTERSIPVEPLVCQSRFDLSAIRAIRHRLKESNFDILHAFTGRTLSNAMLASWGLQIGRVAYRGTAGHVSRLDPSSWLTWLNPRLDRVSCVSEAVRQYLKNCGVPEQKLVTIHKGHELAWYDSLPAVERSRFDIPQDAFIIVCTANMRPVKGVDILIRSLAYFPPELKPHVLLIGEMRDPAILKLIRQHQKFAHFHTPGFLADAAAVCRIASVFVMPSRAREGFPKALIEAMALSIPVVVSAAGGLPEIVRNELDGLVFEPEDAESLGRILVRLMQQPDLLSRLGSAARQRVETSFTVSQTVEKTLSLYSSVTVHRL